MDLSKTVFVLGAGIFEESGSKYTSRRTLQPDKYIGTLMLVMLENLKKHIKSGSIHLQKMGKPTKIIP